ncbi:hypothetical protein [Jiangella alkaliphila]|uniref:Uncharacterized protein n=1 Tax=Jiangella alkaliphila TaxID=419479 RepID=A0A1H2L6J3_9ACTN|nr:hypothetical protein [Jiangella alkaliphila]SDU76579.1 hypothetical protein SAMN04488563_5248 [Jiangella alkaliphila]
MEDTLTRSEFEELVAMYRRQGVEVDVRWEHGGTNPMLVFRSATDEERIAIEAAAMRVVPRADEA